MVFTESQRLVLFAGWKNGYLSDSKNYGKISEFTGLSRKQVSNWARSQIIKLGNEPLPQKSATPLSSILGNLFLKPIVKRHRSPEDSSSSISPDMAPKRRKKLRIRFTEDQRKVLSLSWERGFLCDNQHYGSISQITGLTRKQISNWARARMNKCGKDCLPSKNPAPIKSIFKDMWECIGSCPWSVIPQCVPKESQFSMHAAESIKQNIPLSLSSCYQQSSTFNTTRFADDRCLPDRCLPPKCMPINCVRADETKLNDNGQPRSVVKPEFEKRSGPFELCSRNRRGAFEQFRPMIDLPINQCVLQVALEGINVLSDAKVDNIATLTGFGNHELRYWLISHGWRAAPEEQGIRYERIISNNRSSNSVFQSLN